MKEEMMLRLMERVHGHLGWLSIAALLHPAILLRNPRRKTPLAVMLATGMVTLSGSLGAWIYPDYRRLLKLHIFVNAPGIGWLFERKEHLAVGVLVFTWMGCIAHLSVSRFPEAQQERMSKIAHRSFVMAAGMALLVGIFGVVVAAYESF